MPASPARPDETAWGTLLDEAWARQERPVRLLGVGVRFADADPRGEAQADLFDRRNVRGT